MTIEKATSTIMHIKHNTILNHGVRKFWIYWTLRLLTLWNYMEHLGNFTYFLDLCISDGPLTNFATNFHEISIISSNKGGNRWTIDRFYGIFQIFPETQAMLTQRQRKFELFNPSQAKPHLRTRCSSIDFFKFLPRNH